jgi:hypothetical protein
VTATNASRRRISRLRQELFDELGLKLTEEALDELTYARYMEPHEGTRAAYGAVVWNTALRGAPPLPSPAGFLDSHATLDVLRTFADGRTSFVIRGPGIAPALAVDPAWRGTESDLATYAARVGVTVIQRLATGRVRLYLADHVYSEEGGIWLARPTAAAYQKKLAHVVDVHHHDTAQAILDLCVHSLSPAGHGATLVWFPGGMADSEAFLDFSVMLTPPALSATDPTHGPAISHALGQMDRAAILDATGRLIHLNVSLQHADVNAAVALPGGTRHNSAARYSASQEQAVVFVISADGPVTVLHRGSVVAAIH